MTRAELRAEGRGTSVAVLLACSAAASLALLAFALYGCAGVAPPKPCPLLDAQYTAELVTACRSVDAGSIAECQKTKAFEDAQAKHRADQLDAGCRK